MRLDEEKYAKHRDRVDRAASAILEGLVASPCCCDRDRLAEGWMDSGCKYHRPVRSFAKATDWMREE